MYIKIRIQLYGDGCVVVLYGMMRGTVYGR